MGERSLTFEQVDKGETWCTGILVGWCVSD